MAIHMHRHLARRRHRRRVAPPQWLAMLIAHTLASGTLLVLAHLLGTPAPGSGP